MIDLTPARDTMLVLLGGVTADQLVLPTPCAEYTVRDLIEHVDGAATGFAALARGDDPPDDEPTGAPAAAVPDWRDGVAKHVWALGEAWRDPAAWRGSSTVAGGLELPNERWGKIALTELVVHGWDLAKATGQPFELAEPALRACYEHVAEFVPNAPVAGLWGPAVGVPEDAPLLDRLLAITGRTP
jgi:uncharacterized protein (TIGR03086 family)